MADYKKAFPDGFPSPSLFAHAYYINTKAAFLALKPRMRHLGPVKGFDGFVLPLPAGIDRRHDLLDMAGRGG